MRTLALFILCLLPVISFAKARSLSVAEDVKITILSDMVTSYLGAKLCYPYRCGPHGNRDRFDARNAVDPIHEIEQVDPPDTRQQQQCEQGRSGQ